ncbi:MAG: DUF1015 domain-containing protein [Actinobacteria bacterium]|nr:MAG: DUF1015 domain-containing protein [Actinomycetota bacterium]
MTTVPFKAIRYNQSKVPLEKVVAPPYDVISPKRQEELFCLHPNNVVRLILGKENPADNEQDNRYTRSAADFHKWLDEGVLKADEKEAYYVYEQTFNWHKQTYIRTGVIAKVKLRELGDGIYPHEKTMPKAKADRYKLTEAAKANFSPVFALYESKDNVARLLRSIKHRPSDISIVDDRGIWDKIWVVDEPSQVQRITEAIQGNDIFIADGHHRYETALNFYKNHPDIESAAYVMMMLIEMSDEGLVVLPAHRVVSLGSYSDDSLLDKLKYFFDIKPIDEDIDKVLDLLHHSQSVHGFVMLLQDKFYQLSFRNARELTDLDFDVTILHKFVLEDILRIDSSMIEERVVFTKEPSEAYKLAGAPRTAAFFLNPTPIEALKRVARAHQTMPQKSTYFYPKPLSGLVINKF